MDDYKNLVATVSKASKADAEKGRAIKRQRVGFDALINARIKLQKGAAAVSNFADVEDGAAAVNPDSLKSVETAAVSLWNTIESLRYALLDAQTQPQSESGDESRKRKREDVPSSNTDVSAIWDRMEDLESQALPHRRAVLEKWSLRTKAAQMTLPNARGKLLNTSNQQTLSGMLDAYVASENKSHYDHHDDSAEEAKNTLIPQVYDDSKFYQTLLRDLVEERMTSSNGLNGTAGVENLTSQLSSRFSLAPKTNVAGMRKDKIKRAVDTKASKGRKMKFTVHEKLQNFMAPEDRTTWDERARREFFASLFGQSTGRMLGEEEEDSESEEENVEEEGLRLFRN